jgi:amino acid transporter
MIMASRIVYGMARQGIIPSGLGRVDGARQTPVLAIVFTTLRGEGVDHDHFRIPTWVPAAGFVISLAVMTPKEGEIFLRAAALLAVGVVLYVINRLLTGPRGPFKTEELEVLKG